MKTEKNGLKFFFAIALPALAADAASKAWVQRSLPLDQPVPVFPGFNLTYVLNPGAAFSLLTGLPDWLRLPFFLTVTLAALAAVAFMLRAIQGRDPWTEAALALISAGALGNLADRLRLGKVVDFLEFGVPQVYTWPVFNVADSAVCVGVGIMVWKSLFKKEVTGNG